MSERAATGGIVRIGLEEYAPFRELAHLFVAGDLKRPTPHPFVRDKRMELILCFYEPGQDGEPHWHPGVTEYEVVVEGEVAYRDSMKGETVRFRAGDCCVIPAGVCVERLAPARARTIAIKVPSADDAVRCSMCARACCARIEPARDGLCA